MHGGFTNNANIYVLVQNGAFKDLAGNAFVGISQNNSWTFTTETTSGTKTIEAFNIMLYPNPSNGTIYIYNRSNINCKIKTILDMLGKEVVFEVNQKSNDLMEVKLLERNGGLYQVIFDNNGQQFHKKIMVVK